MTNLDHQFCLKVGNEFRNIPWNVRFGRRVVFRLLVFVMNQWHPFDSLYVDSNESYREAILRYKAQRRMTSQNQERIALEHVVDVFG